MGLLGILSIFVLVVVFYGMCSLTPALDEEIGNAVRLTQGGAVVNERLKG